MYLVSFSTTDRLVLTLVYMFLSVCNTHRNNPLNGNHLRVVPMEYPVALATTRNATGHVVQFDGGLKQHLLALSKVFNFSFSFLPVKAPLMEGTEFMKGGLQYLINDEADFILGAAVATPYRLNYADFPASWLEADFFCIIPYPKEKLNIAASLKPLSFQVWITIIAAGITAIIYLRFSIENEFRASRKHNKDWKGNTWQVIHFVLRNLVSQGQFQYSSRLTFRIAAGAWCCGCFFLVQIYCSTLTSHLTSPNQKPIANSVQELVDTPGLSFTVQRNYGLDITLQNSKFGISKKLASSSNKDPSFRCNLTSDCLKIVRNGYAGYGDTINNLKLIMDKDIKTTGKCHYYIMKDLYLRLSVFTPLRKNSPYTEIISNGLLLFQQAGLSGYWESWYVPTPWKCLEINRRDKIARLSLGHLSSAFVILLFGFVLGFGAFCFELVKFRLK